MALAGSPRRARRGPGLLLALLSAMAAAAAAAEAPAPKAWQRLDRDGKGYVTFEDFVHASDERLARMDRNGDGNIGRDEFMAYHEAEARRRAERLFAALDRKRTGRIAAADLGGEAARRLLACDADKDGAVTRAEYLACRHHSAERWMQRIFAKYDKNGDGFIGRDERIAALRDFFARLDANGDGRIDRDEFAAAQRRWAERRNAAGRSAGPSPDADEVE